MNIHEKSLIVWANNLTDVELKKALEIQMDFKVSNAWGFKEDRNITIITIKNVMKKRKLRKLNGL